MDLGGSVTRCCASMWQMGNVGSRSLFLTVLWKLAETGIQDQGVGQFCFSRGLCVWREDLCLSLLDRDRMGYLTFPPLTEISPLGILNSLYSPLPTFPRSLPSFPTHPFCVLFFLKKASLVCAAYMCSRMRGLPLEPGSLPGAGS